MTDGSVRFVSRSAGSWATVAAVGLSLASVGCWATPEYGDDVSSKLQYASGTENPYGTSNATLSLPPPVPTAPPAYPTPAAAPSSGVTRLVSVTMSFAEGSAPKVHRVCSDNGAKRSRGSVYQAAGLVVVPVASPTCAASALMTDVPGQGMPGLSQLKASVASNGTLAFAMDARLIGPTPTLFAIVAVGGGFGSPYAATQTIAPPLDGDAENFAENSGIVGYFEAYADPNSDGARTIATPKSQLLWASNPRVEKANSGGWLGPNDGTGCDQYDSPLVLDLSASCGGVALGATSNDVFDIDGDGTRDRLSWIASQDTPFLVLDGNGNGVVDGIDELFGNRTRGPDGSRASKNGFDALARHDANADGAIDRSDPIWHGLRLWFDRNRDGRTDAGELETLRARGIRAIGIGYASTSEGLFVGGALEGAIKQRGSAYATDGRSISVVDVWFRR